MPFTISRFVTLLLHYCYIIVTLLLHYCYIIVTLLLKRQIRNLKSSASWLWNIRLFSKLYLKSSFCKLARWWSEGPKHVAINILPYIDSSWNVMAHGNAQEGKWRGNWRMEWVASTLHTTWEHGVSSINYTSAASGRPNWRPRRFKWTRPFRRKTKSGFCACANTFQLASTYLLTLSW